MDSTTIEAIKAFSPLAIPVTGIVTMGVWVYNVTKNKAEKEDLKALQESNEEKHVRLENKIDTGYVHLENKIDTGLLRVEEKLLTEVKAMLTCISETKDKLHKMSNNISVIALEKQLTREFLCMVLDKTSPKQ